MSEYINELNKIYINSTLKVDYVNMTTLVFSDNLICSKKEYTIADNMLFLKNQPDLTLNMFQFADDSRYYEFLVNLTQKDTKISGIDRYGDLLFNLSNTVLVFVNGYKLEPQEYVIDEEDNSITIKSQFKEKALSTVIIYTSLDSIYRGNVEKDPSWNPETNEFNLKGYTTSRYIFFKNGELLPSNKVQKVGDKIRLNTPIKHGIDLIDYYEMSQECYSLSFTPILGYLTYGPEDDKGTMIQNPYNCILTFNNIVRYAIDDVRTGFFVHEKDTDGCIMIVDDSFENKSVKCLIIRDFRKTVLEPEDYFITVPDAPTILRYVSQYDLNGVLFKELMASFQKVLLNETYDSIQRIKNVRNINNVDSSNVSALINFLGMKINITDLTLEQKHNLLEELRSFYNIVGTKDSYNFYNIFNRNGKIIDIKQLFTPIKSRYEEGRKVERYVDFKTAEELGAILKQKYITDVTDFGEVNEIAIDGVNLKNTPKFDGILRYVNYPAILEGFIDRYHSNRTEVYLSRDQINFFITIESDVYEEDVSENEEYEYTVKSGSTKMFLDRYIGNSRTVTVPQTIVHEQKTMAKITVTPNNLSAVLYDSSGNKVQLYKYDQLTNTYKYIIDKQQQYTYKIIDEDKNVLYTHELQQERILDSGITYVNSHETISWVKVKENDQEKIYDVHLFNNVIEPEEKIVFIDYIGRLTPMPFVVSDPYYSGEFRKDGQFTIKKYNIDVIVGVNDIQSKFILQFEKATLDDLKIDMPYGIYKNITDNGFNSERKPDEIIDGVIYNVLCCYYSTSFTFRGHGENHIATITFKENPSVQFEPEHIEPSTGEPLVDEYPEDVKETIYVSLPMSNGYISDPQIGPNRPTIDCGYINDTPVDFYDFGSVTDPIDGQWISWYEWERPRNWYPTNHVDVSLDIPANVNYKDFINLFKDTFYEIASTVIYIHQLTQVYTFDELCGDVNTNEAIRLLTTQPYRTEEQCFTTDPKYLPYRQATSNPPLKLKSFAFLNPEYTFENDQLKVTVELHKTYFTNDYLSKVTGNNNDITYVERLVAFFPCERLNYTTWTSEQQIATQTTANINHNDTTYIPNLTVTRIPTKSWSNWCYAVVINKPDRDEAYTVSKDLQTSTLVVQSNTIQRAQVIVDNVVCYKRPNSVIYHDGSWQLAYASIDKNLETYNWKKVTLSNENAANEREASDVGIAQLSFDRAKSIGWTAKKIIVSSRTELENSNLNVYLSEDNKIYEKINRNFTIGQFSYTKEYSYTDYQNVWSCTLKQYCAYNTAVLSAGTKDNFATILLPTNIVYRDRISGITYDFGQNNPIVYTFENLGATIQSSSVTHDQYRLYDYNANFAAKINDSEYRFSSFGSLVTPR